jgi:hypothetical protein
MLFSSGDSPQSASSNLSGEGFDEVPGESPFVVSTAFHLPTSLTPVTANTVESRDNLVLLMDAIDADQRNSARTDRWIWW